MMNLKSVYPRLFFLAIVILFLKSNPISAQQLPLFNQARENLNPAYISPDYYKYDLSSTLSLRYRQQWVGLKGAPKTIMGNFTNWNDESSLLLGGDLINDETGPTGFTGIYGRIGYGLELGKDLLLTAGIKGGLVQYRVKGEELQFLESGDIANENITKLYPDFSFGAMLYYDEQYYVGFSIPQMFGLDLQIKDAIGDYNIQRVRHYYGIVGARFDLGSDSWIEPSSEMRYVEHVPFYFNGKLDFEFRHMFWISASGSSAKELGIGIGVINDLGINNNPFRLGYTFSNFFQEYGPDYGTVHELGVSYSW